MKRSRQVSRWGAIAFCGLAAACSTPASSTPEAENSADVVEKAVHPEPTVAFAVDSETNVELYDFPAGVMVMETGKAGRANTILLQYRELVKSKRFVDLFKTLRPDAVVPEELIALEAKAKTALPSKVIRQAGTLPPPPAGNQILEGNACGNVCCDYTWLNANICSGLSGDSYDWFLFDYGWSYVNASSDTLYSGAACAGIGTSLFTVSVGDGSGGTWSVPAGYYRTYWWLAGCYFLDCPDTQSVYTSVNSSGNQHLHTYCGKNNY